MEGFIAGLIVGSGGVVCLVTMIVGVVYMIKEMRG